MTFLRIFAMVVVASLVIDGLEVLFGELRTRVTVFLVISVVVSYQFLRQRWHRQ